MAVVGYNLIYLSYKIAFPLQVTITQIDTACMLIDLNGFRIVTDPAFDLAGGTCQSGAGRVLKKNQSPAIWSCPALICHRIFG